MRIIILLMASAGLAAAATPVANAVSIAAGDFNNDGSPDLVVANSLGGSVSVLLGNGDGTFQPATQIAVGGTPIAVAAADWNGDGKTDIVLTNQAAVVVLPGNGDGTFATPLRLEAGPVPAGFAIGDLNGDGRPDLVVTNLVPTLWMILNGSGSQLLGLPGGGGPPVEKVAMADVNGDGNPDLVVTTAFSSSVVVLLGRGDGTFAAPRVFPFAGLATMPVILDLNGDKQPDIALSIAGAGFALLPGHGDGTFGSAIAFPFGTECEALVTADFNRDGFADLAVISRSVLGAKLGVALGTGSSGGISLQQFDLPLKDARGMVVSDFNQDGIPDLAIAQGLDNVLSILLGNGDGTFADPVILGGAEADRSQPTALVVLAAMSEGVAAIDVDKKSWFASVAAGGLVTVASSPDGERAYVGSSTTIAAVDRGLAGLQTMPVTGLPPQSLVVSPDGSRLYAAAAREVDVFDTATGRRVTTIPIDPGQGMAVLSKDGSRLVVSIGNSISVIDTATNKIVRSIADPDSLSLALAPDGRTLYVGNTFDSATGICNVPDAALFQVYDMETGSKIREGRPGGSSCAGTLVLSSDGSTLHAADSMGGRVRVIDAATMQQMDSIAVSGGVTDLALMPDGSRLLVAGVQGLSIVDLQTKEVQDRIPLGFPVTRIAIQPAATR